MPTPIPFHPLLLQRLGMPQLAPGIAPPPMPPLPPAPMMPSPQMPQLQPPPQMAMQQPSMSPRAPQYGDLSYGDILGSGLAEALARGGGGRAPRSLAEALGGIGGALMAAPGFAHARQQEDFYADQQREDKLKREEQQLTRQQESDRLDREVHQMAMATARQKEELTQRALDYEPQEPTVEELEGGWVRLTDSTGKQTLKHIRPAAQSAERKRECTAQEKIDGRVETTLEDGTQLISIPCEKTIVIKPDGAQLDLPRDVEKSIIKKGAKAGQEAQALIDEQLEAGGAGAAAANLLTQPGGQRQGENYAAMVARKTMDTEFKLYLNAAKYAAEARSERAKVAAEADGGAGADLGAGAGAADSNDPQQATGQPAPVPPESTLKARLELLSANNPMKLEGVERDHKTLQKNQTADDAAADLSQIYAELAKISGELPTAWDSYEKLVTGVGPDGEPATPQDPRAALNRIIAALVLQSRESATAP